MLAAPKIIHHATICPHVQRWREALLGNGSGLSICQRVFGVCTFAFWAEVAHALFRDVKLRSTMNFGMNVKAWQMLLFVKKLRNAEISQPWDEAVAGGVREQNVLFFYEV